MKIDRLLKLGAVIMLLLTSIDSVVGTIPDARREALIALYKSTNGGNWTHKDNWLGPAGTEGSWYGLTFDSTGYLLSLSLQNNNLSGPIPPELRNLHCTGIELDNNRLSGPIPPELGNDAPGIVWAWLTLSHNNLSGPIPPELAKHNCLMRLDLSSNKLSGPIPPELAKLRFLAALILSHNNLSGPIPSELGKLERLGGLTMSSNNLSGPIPPELGNLKKLKEGNCDFRYNALYTNDTSLRDFLNSKQIGGDWEGTQTVAPTKVTAEALTEDSIKVSWTPIRFKEFGGGYRVFYSTSSGGPYTLFGATDDKNASYLTVTGLKPGTTYYFVVQSVTSPHDLNNNTVMSEYSNEAIGR
ncbi:MAG TPA: fibronectin type III domain-containing protein [Patescibacteria group bacterium]|nr:fibronectin type III domain-containing protein [Patescibacteria group bacterium]